MANTINTKTTAVKVDTPAATTKGPVTLTVVVVDDKGQPTAGANVSITPANASGVTNAAGEIQFTLSGAMKYNVTASYGSNTVTVPYYVTKDGATRLVVNPVYVKQVEHERNQFWMFRSPVVKNIGIGLGVLIVLVVIWKLFRRRKNSRQEVTPESRTKRPV